MHVKKMGLNENITQCGSFALTHLLCFLKILFGKKVWKHFMLVYFTMTFQSNI